MIGVTTVSIDAATRQGAFMNKLEALVDCDSDVAQSVMVVDSDRRVRTALTQLLKATHPRVAVVETADATTALDTARSASFDLVLVDMGLPDLDGSCSLIRQLAGDHHVVALSVRQEHAQHALAAGALDFVEKTSSEKLLQAVMTILSGSLTGLRSESICTSADSSSKS